MSPLTRQLGVIGKSEMSTVDVFGLSEIQNTATSFAETLGRNLRMASGSSAMPSMPSAVSHDEHASSAAVTPRADSSGLDAGSPAMLTDNAYKFSQFCITDTASPIANRLPPYSLDLHARPETSPSEQIRNGGFPGSQFQDANVPTSEISNSTTTSSSDNLPMQYNGEVSDETSLSATTLSSDGLPMRRQNGEIRGPSYSLPLSVQEPDLPLSQKHPGDSNMSIVPVDEIPGDPDIPASSSRRRFLDSAIDTAQPGKPEAILPFLDNQNVDPIDLNFPADMVSKVVLKKVATHSASSNDSSPSPPMISSAPILTVGLPFLPSPTTCQVERTEELGVLTPDQDTPALPAFILPPVTSQPTSVPQQVDIPPSPFTPSPQPPTSPGPLSFHGCSSTSNSAVPRFASEPQPQESHPTNISQPVDIRQGTDMPQCTDMDVDMLSDVDVDSNGSDFDSDGYMRDSDDNELRSGRILKSATYRRLKSQPVSWFVIVSASPLMFLNI